MVTWSNTAATIAAATGTRGAPTKRDSPMRTRRVLALPLLLLAAAAAPNADAAVGSAGVAALQVALRTHGLYTGSIDGITGPRTERAVRRLQRRAHLSVDGVA